MKTGLLLTVLAIACGAMVAAEDAAAAGKNPVSFSREIAPILVSKCLGCHNAEKAKGRYRLHTYEALMQPGSSKSPSVNPGNPEGSELYKRLTANDPDDRMPQKDEALPASEIELFKRWIAEGANTEDRTNLLSAIVPRQPFPCPPARYPRPMPVLALAFTPDGKQLAVSGHNEVTFWSLGGVLESRVTNVVQRVHAIAFDPKSSAFAVAGGKPGRSGELSLYDRKTGGLLTNLVRGPDELLTVVISSDGRRVAAGGADNAIHIFDLPARRLIICIQQHADWVTALDFNTDATRVASASRDRTARIYNTAGGDLETTYAGHESFVFGVAFLPSGRVASGGRDKVIDIWDESEGKRKAQITGFEGEIYKVICSGRGIFTAGADKTIRQYAIEDRRLVHSFGPLSDVAYALAVDDEAGHVAAGGYDGVVRIWNIQTGTLEQSFVAAPGYGVLN